jgi:cell division protein FtsW
MQTAVKMPSEMSLGQDSYRRKKLAVLSDTYFLATALIVVLFGLLMVYSTTTVVAEEKLGDGLYYVKRQGMAAVVGLALLWLGANLNFHKIKAISKYLLPVSAVLLLLVFVPGIGLKGGGALRWVGLGPIRFQPVELVKIFMVLFLSGYIARNSEHLAEFKRGLLVPLSSFALIWALLLAQPDFGSSAVLGIIAISLIFCCGGSIKLLGAGALGLGLLGASLIVVSPYRMKRIFAFLDPFKDSSGQGYQLIQSLIAIGNGGTTGVGIGESQQKLFFLPAAHNDFIFAVIGEELGFVGCVVLLALFCFLLYRGLLIAKRLASNTFYFAASLGLTMLLTLPAFLNMGVALGLLPTKGLALPLVSYGGSSLMASLFVVGLLLSLNRTAERLESQER